MERITVADASRTLETALAVLDNAYWEVSKINHKDVLYDMISVMHAELNELAKLSVEDHLMTYEPISLPFRKAVANLKLLQKNVSNWVCRSTTAQQLQIVLPNVIHLLSRHD